MSLDNIRLGIKKVSEITGNFIIPSYQRGYRWGKNEVTTLLNDILNIDGSGNYCLQPIVVRRVDNYYELIDGQQRLTTLYLIYKFLNNYDDYAYEEPKFTLSYDTRKGSEKFLKNIYFCKEEKKIIDKGRDENIDYFFIANAFKTIREWFEEDRRKRTNRIGDYLDNLVNVIWYEVDETEDAAEMFTRLNIGKIPLTNSELVKAMILSKDHNELMSYREQEEISLQWDLINKELNYEPLWGFLSNNELNANKTRIDLILDIVANKNNNEKEEYYTFFYFNKFYKNKLSEAWYKIQRTFLKLKDWFENHEFYHKIGFLITSEYMTIIDIYRLSKGKKKSEFIKALDIKIKESIKIDKNYGELTYENSQDSKKIKKLLLLFNIESVRKIEGKSRRFPFYKLKFGDKKWSLEHVHAQNSEGLSTENEWREWLELHKKFVKDVIKNKDLDKKIESVLNYKKIERHVFENIQQDIFSKLSITGDVEYLHSIANLTLLNTRDNAALSNAIFDVKRDAIINIDKKGKYIPFCTRMLFLKYYTPSEKNNIHFWSNEDRVCYIRAINDMLENYLEEPIIVEGIIHEN